MREEHGANMVRSHDTMVYIFVYSPLGMCIFQLYNYFAISNCIFKYRVDCVTRPVITLDYFVKIRKRISRTSSCFTRICVDICYSTDFMNVPPNFSLGMNFGKIESSSKILESAKVYSSVKYECVTELD